MFQKCWSKKFIKCLFKCCYKATSLQTLKMLLLRYYQLIQPTLATFIWIYFGIFSLSTMQGGCTPTQLGTDGQQHLLSVLSAPEEPLLPSLGKNHKAFRLLCHKKTMGNTLETVTPQGIGEGEMVIWTLSFTFHLRCSMKGQIPLATHSAHLWAYDQDWDKAGRAGLLTRRTEKYDYLHTSLLDYFSGSRLPLRYRLGRKDGLWLFFRKDPLSLLKDQMGFIKNLTSDWVACESNSSAHMHIHMLEARACAHTRVVGPLL